MRHKNSIFLHILLWISFGTLVKAEIILSENKPEWSQEISGDSLTSFEIIKDTNLDSSWRITLSVYSMKCQSGSKHSLEIYEGENSHNLASFCSNFNFSWDKYHLVQKAFDGDKFYVEWSNPEGSNAPFMAKVVATLYKSVRECDDCDGICCKGRDCTHALNGNYRCISKSLGCNNLHNCGPHCGYDEIFCRDCDQYPDNCYWFVWTGMFFLVLLTLLPALLVVMLLFWCRQRRIVYERERHRREILNRVVSRSPPNDLPPNYLQATVIPPEAEEKPPSFTAALEMENKNMTVHRTIDPSSQNN